MVKVRILRLIAALALVATLLELAPASFATTGQSTVVVPVSTSSPTDPAAYLGVSILDSQGTAIGAGMPLTLQQPLGTTVASGTTEAGGEVTFVWTLKTAGDAYVFYDGTSFGPTQYASFGPTKAGTYQTPTTQQLPPPVIGTGSVAPIVSNRAVPRSARAGKRVPMVIGLNSPTPGISFATGAAVLYSGAKQVGSIPAGNTENTFVIFKVALRAGTRHLHAAYLVNGTTVSVGPAFSVKVKTARRRR